MYVPEYGCIKQYRQCFVYQQQALENILYYSIYDFNIEQVSIYI